MKKKLWVKTLKAVQGKKDFANIKFFKVMYNFFHQLWQRSILKQILYERFGAFEVEHEL